MNASLPPPGQISQRGAQLYEKFRPVLEPLYNGKFVVIDVDTGDYEVETDHLAASNRAAAKRPGASLFATRVGQRVSGASAN